MVSTHRKEWAEVKSHKGNNSIMTNTPIKEKARICNTGIYAQPDNNHTREVMQFV